MIALDALTGKLRWYYQMVHHDLWDYDMNAPPALIEVKRDGQTIPAVAETNKMSLLFILDRRTGKPIFGVEERPVPKGDTARRVVFAHRAVPYQASSAFSHLMTREDISRRTPEAEKFCSEWLSRLRLRGPYTPFGLTPSLSMPGTMGGGNWGGVSFDPQLGYIFVNTSSLGTVGQMAATAAGALQPYHNLGGYTRFIDQDGYPCQQPPWGEMIARECQYRRKLFGENPSAAMTKLEAQGLKNTGRRISAVP